MPSPALNEVALPGGAPVARYYALFSLLRDGIRDGAYQPGSRLPTVTDLVGRYQVSRTTVARALDELERAGLVESRWGAGTFVAPPPLPTVELLIAGNRPSPGRHRAVFFDHLLDSVKTNLGDSPCRVTMNYTIEFAPSSGEILAVARARRAQAIVAYRPDEALRSELARVAEQMPVVSLFVAIPQSRVDSVLFDPAEVVRRLFRERLAAGRRVFAYALCRRFHEPRSDSPYAILYEAFIAAAAEAGVEPVVISFDAPDASAPADHAAMDRLRALPSDAIVFADSLARVDFPGERFQFTESPETLAALRNRGTRVVYVDFRQVCRAAGELLRRRAASPALPGRALSLAPELVMAGDTAISQSLSKEDRSWLC